MVFPILRHRFPSNVTSCNILSCLLANVISVNSLQEAMHWWCGKYVERRHWTTTVLTTENFKFVVLASPSPRLVHSRAPLIPFTGSVPMVSPQVD